MPPPLRQAAYGGSDGIDDILTIAQIEAQFASESVLVEAPQTNRAAVLFSA